MCSHGCPEDSHQLSLVLPNGALVFYGSDEVLDCRFQRWIGSHSRVYPLAGMHHRGVISSAELKTNFCR